MTSCPNYMEFDKTFKKQSPEAVFAGFPSDVVDLLYRMLDYNPKTRITAEEVMKVADDHP